MDVTLFKPAPCRPCQAHDVRRHVMVPTTPGSLIFSSLCGRLKRWELEESQIHLFPVGRPFVADGELCLRCVKQANSQFQAQEAPPP